MPILSSRPNQDEHLFSLSLLTYEELELVAALLYNTTLGSGVSVYRDAAGDLMSKIEEFMDDANFLEESSEVVDAQIKILSDSGEEIDVLPGTNFEILV
jgi:hypothetical protein